MSVLSDVKNIISIVLEDGNEHTTKDFINAINKNGICLSPNSSAIRTAIYQLRNSGKEIYSREKGIYQNLSPTNKLTSLSGFSVLQPPASISAYKLFVHDDGKIVMNGKLNSIINSRNVEIRISNDHTRIALIPNGYSTHKFTKNGQTKNVLFINELQKRNFQFPITYKMEYSENDKVWIGSIIDSKKQKK